MGNRSKFEKDLRSYLTDATEYDIKRIMQIYDRHDTPEVLVKTEKVYLTKTEKVYVYESQTYNDVRSLQKGKTPFREINADDILKICCEAFNVPMWKVLGKLVGSYKYVSYCRHCAAYMMYKYTFMSQPEVGQYLGGRDHTTARTSMAKIKDVLDVKQDYYEPVIKAIDELYLLIKQRKDAKRNTKRTSGSDTSDLQTEGVLRQAI